MNSSSSSNRPRIHIAEADPLLPIAANNPAAEAAEASAPLELPEGKCCEGCRALAAKVSELEGKLNRLDSRVSGIAYRR